MSELAEDTLLEFPGAIRLVDSSYEFPEAARPGNTFEAVAVLGEWLGCCRTARVSIKNPRGQTVLEGEATILFER